RSAPFPTRRSSDLGKQAGRSGRHRLGWRGADDARLRSREGDRPAPNGPVPPGIMPGHRPRWKDSGSCPEGIGAPADAPPEHRAAGPGSPPGPAAGSVAVRQDTEAREAGPHAGPGHTLTIAPTTHGPDAVP